MVRFLTKTWWQAQKHKRLVHQVGCHTIHCVARRTLTTLFLHTVACVAGSSVTNTYIQTSAASTSTAFTASSHNWHSAISTPVYQPTPVAPKPQVAFNWLSPPSSTQTSPALSVISASDKEVELTMKDKSCLTFDRLTPSPSPLPKEPFHDENKKSDDIDSFLNEISTGLINETTASSIDFVQEFPDFFGSETVAENPYSCDTNYVSLEPVEHLPIDIASLAVDEPGQKPVSEVDVPLSTTGNSLHHLSQHSLTFFLIGGQLKSLKTIAPHPDISTPSLKTSQALRTLGVSQAQGSSSSKKPARVIRLAKVQSLPNGVHRTRLPGLVQSNAATVEATTSAVNSTSVQTGAPTKRPSTLACTSVAKKSRLTNPVVVLNRCDTPERGRPSKSSSTPTPATTPRENPPTPQVALELAADGTPVFMVQPRAVPATPTTSKPKRGRPPGKKTSSSTPRTATDKPKKTPAKGTQPKKANHKKTKVSDESFIESIVSKFVQQANSRKAPPATK